MIVSSINGFNNTLTQLIMPFNKNHGRLNYIFTSDNREGRINPIVHKIIYAEDTQSFTEIGSDKNLTI
jgi:hypothetical protein